MKLPNAKQASIKREKLVNYLLSLTHPAGKSKAKFFREIGFNETNLEFLRHELFKIAQSNEVIKVDDTNSEYVVEYVIDGIINSPTGKQYKLRTIWRIKIGEKIPALVSAYPNKKRKEKYV